MVDRDPENQSKQNQADQNDKEEEEKVEAFLKPLKEKSDYAKLMAYNEPKFLIFIAFVTSVAAGFTKPLYGVTLSKVMAILVTPMIVWDARDWYDGTDNQF